MGATGGPAAGAMFLGLEGIEGASPIMLRRTPLELVAVRHAVKGSRRVSQGRLLEDAGPCGPRQDGRQAAASGSRQRACAPPPAARMKAIEAAVATRQPATGLRAPARPMTA